MSGLLLSLLVVGLKTILIGQPTLVLVTELTSSEQFGIIFLMLKSTETKSQTIDREVMANILTLLSYLKISLAFIVAGAMIVESTDNPFAHFAGWTFMALGGWLAVRKEARFQELRKFQ